MKHLYMTGLLFGVTDLEFDVNRPYSGCLICGVIFQSTLDRTPGPDSHDAQELRKAWTKNHAKTHPLSAHAQLALSERWCTPEAAIKLAAFGVIPLSDAAVSEEHRDALSQAKSLPENDAETKVGF